MTAERMVIVGGGAAGFFAAITCGQARAGNEIIVLERSSNFLTKVRISGGGRCNVTHRAMDARSFSDRYPRGARPLISALHRFSAEDTSAWFERHGVRLKTEADGRIFPITDSSGTVIDCLLFEANAAGVQLKPRLGVEEVRRLTSGQFELLLTNKEKLSCDRLLLATGGARDFGGAAIAHSLGHTIEPPVPSLFSLHVADTWLKNLPGVSVADVSLAVPTAKLRERGPLLITHHGLSGPAVLRISAWGARPLAECDYKFTLQINWLPQLTENDIAAEIQRRRATQPNKQIVNSLLGALPARLWEELVRLSVPEDNVSWTRLRREDSLALVRRLHRTEVTVEGKSLNKDEFVTCGGVRLNEVDFKTMESRLVPHLYFAGELLDIDGITGGFNFQAAWTTGWIAGQAMADETK